MDPSRFDGLARGVAGLTSRRTTLAALLAGLAVPLLGDGESEARKQSSNHHRQSDRNRDHDVDKEQRHAGRSVDAEKKKKKNKKKCRGGTRKCGKKCINLQTDASHCGACGNVCQSGGACVNGACLLPARCGTGAACSGGQTCCNDICADTESNYANCGACGQSCRANETCENGDCTCGGNTCTPSERCCDGATCSSVDMDHDHCGACDHACGANEQCCGGQCVNATTVQNCGSCGNVCPGHGLPNTNVTCNNGNTCTFNCQGDSYDVDGNAATGCERVYTFGNHSSGLATPLGDVACNAPMDSTADRFFFSDARTHSSPAIVGFDPTTGSAPHWWVINATGGAFCSNDLDITLTMTGATGHCYKLTVLANDGAKSWAAQTSNGVAHIQEGAGAYSSGTQVFLKVEKTCGTNVREAPSYTISYTL